MDGREYPVHDWTRVRSSQNRALGVVCPDVFGMSGSGAALEFTLLRSPPYSWHDPLKLETEACYRWTDQGEHTFRFVLAPDAEPARLRQLALMEHRPPFAYDWTAGMAGE